MPYYEQPYDNRASMARLSDLARMRANVLSDAEQRAAMARAAMVSGIGQIVGGTLADLATYQTGERARKKAEGEAAARKDTLRMTSALPAEQQAGELRAAGYLEDADRAEARAEHLSDRKDRKEQSELAAMRARIDQTKTLFGRGAALLSEAERAPERWGEIRPMVIDLAAQVSPDLVDFVPQTPEPGAIRELVTSVQTAAADYAKTAAALKGIESALKKTKDMAEATKHVGTILSATTTPEQWDGIQGLLAKEGVPAEILSAFGGFSPENVQRALAVSTGKADGTLPGSAEQQHLAAWAKANGKTVAQMTPGDMRAARAAWSAASREPDAPAGSAGRKDDPALPVGTRGYLASLLEKHRGNYAAAEAEWNRGFREEQAKHPNLDPQKARAYLQSLFGVGKEMAEGKPQWDAAGNPLPFRAAGFEDAPPSAAPAPVRAEASPMGPGSGTANASPVARPAPTGAPAPVSPDQIPPELRNARPGRYTLADGVWFVTPEGVFRGR